MTGQQGRRDADAASDADAPDADAPDADADVDAAEPRWRVAARDVGLTGVAIVLVVLGAAVATGVLPEPLQRVVFHTPLAIGVLLVGTAWVLWRVARGRR